MGCLPIFLQKLSSSYQTISRWGCGTASDPVAVHHKVDYHRSKRQKWTNESPLVTKTAHGSHETKQNFPFLFLNRDGDTKGINLLNFPSCDLEAGTLGIPVWMEQQQLRGGSCLGRSESGPHPRFSCFQNRNLQQVFVPSCSSGWSWRGLLNPPQHLSIQK